MKTMAGLTVFLLCALWISFVEANGYDHTCTIDDFEARGSIVNVCGVRIVQVIRRTCGRRGIHVGKRSAVQYDSNVQRPPYTLSHQDANKLFTNEKKNFLSQGISCECCVHRCSAQELSDYCATGKSLRRRRSNSYGAKSYITQEEVDEFYEQLERDVLQISTDASPADQPGESEDEQKSLSTAFKDELKRKFDNYFSTVRENRLVDEDELELKRIISQHVMEILVGARNYTHVSESHHNIQTNKPSLSNEQRKQLAEILLNADLV